MGEHERMFRRMRNFIRLGSGVRFGSTDFHAAAIDSFFDQP